MIGKVASVIERQDNCGKTYKFGFITGEDAKDYYFDAFCLDSQYNSMDIFAEGCGVEFDPIVVPEKSNDKALNVHIFNVVEPLAGNTIENSDGEIRFYRPGMIGHIKDAKNNIYRRCLKRGSGEDLIIDSLSQLFYVTKVDRASMDGHVYYPYCLLGATGLLKRFVRGQREFLLVFSHFDTGDWQAKTLKIEMEIRKRKQIIERNLLPNFYLLVSNATNFKEEIDSIKGEPRAAIIPFSFREILDCKNDKRKLEKLILDRFQEYHFENNLLAENKAIEDDNLLFGDRGLIADTIVERCRKKEHSGIFGLRRSGKTSVLNAVLRRLARDDIKFVKIESRSELEYTSTWQIVLYDIAQKIKETIPYASSIVGESKDRYRENAPRCFVSDVKKYCANENHFVVAIDEIELITYNTASATVWQTLEAYSGFWSALRDSGCVLLVCGVNSSINEKSIINFDGKSQDNPMYGRIINCAESQKTYLPAFTDEQTKDMINTLGGYSHIAFSNVYSHINRVFGGQPYAIRQFCAFVFENVKDFREHDKNYEVSVATESNLLKQFNASNAGQSLCETILQHIQHYYEEEYATLSRFAHSPQNYNRMDSKEAQSVDHLIKYGLIDYDYQTGYTLFKISPIRDYIRHNIQKDPVTMDNDERRKYVQDFVAHFEVKLKSHILTYYRTVGQENKFPSKLRNYFTPNPALTPPPDRNTATLGELLNHKKFILYFSRLRKVYTDLWTTIGQIFEANGITKNKFNIYMIELNAGRTDADHYSPSELKAPNVWDIDDETMQRFCLSKKKFEEISL